jgi:hypothetical protein
LNNTLVSAAIVTHKWPLKSIVLPQPSAPSSVLEAALTNQYCQ